MCKMYYLFILFIFFSCDSSVTSSLKNKINDDCSFVGPCEIKMVDVVSSKWDKMYFFNAQASLEDINKALGFKYKYFKDVGKKVIFTNDNQIVSHIDFLESIEGVHEGDVVFEIGYNSVFKTYTPETAKFHVKRSEVGKGYFYLLTE